MAVGVEYVLAGFCVGIAVGASGVGGGTLMTPALMFGFGMSPAYAIGTDLVYSALSKGLGAAFHGLQRTVCWRVAGLMALGSLPASAVTIAVLHVTGLGRIEQRAMTYTLGGVILLTAIISLARPLVRRWLRGQGEHEPSASPFGPRGRVALTVVCGIVLGCVVTLSSAGAGAFGTLALLMLYPEWPASQIVGTDLAHAVALTSVAGIGHLSLGTVNMGVALMLLAGSIPGIYLGTRIGLRLPTGVLRFLMSVILAVSGLGLVL